VLADANGFASHFTTAVPPLPTEMSALAYKNLECTTAQLVVAAGYVVRDGPTSTMYNFDVQYATSVDSLAQCRCIFSIGSELHQLRPVMARCET
jgi:hypothetical protein